MENKRFHYSMGPAIGANRSHRLTAVALRIETG
jgi:hypothetical protein